MRHESPKCGLFPIVKKEDLVQVQVSQSTTDQAWTYNEFRSWVVIFVVMGVTMYAMFELECIYNKCHAYKPTTTQGAK